jgi:hypothetical protein
MFSIVLGIACQDVKVFFKVNRDQPNPKFANNWHFTEFFRIFLLIFSSNFLFLVTEVAIMVDDMNRHQTWPPPVIKKRKFDRNFNKKFLKNPEKGQLLNT